MSRVDKALIFDREKIHINLARLKKHGQIFEIDIDPDLAIRYKQGDNIDIHNILKAQKIFNDAKKGLLASETSMSAIFKTSDPLEVAKIILKEGEIQLTSDYRQKLREEKVKQIINIIHRYAVDPRTDAPHPLTRVKNAFEQAKVKIDEFRPAEDHVQIVLKELRKIMPIKFEVKEIELLIPHQYASRSQTVIKQFGKIIKAAWGSDGSFTGIVEIPGGLEEEFFDKLNSISHGNITSKIIKVK